MSSQPSAGNSASDEAINLAKCIRKVDDKTYIFDIEEVLNNAGDNVEILTPQETLKTGKDVSKELPDSLKRFTGTAMEWAAK
jgi:hypothetical protein